MDNTEIEHLSDKVVVIYCFVDDFMSKIAPKADKQRKFTDAQVITTALLAAKKFHGNYSSPRDIARGSTLDFLASYEGFYRLDKGVFSMRLHRLESVIHLLFRYLSETIKSLNLTQEYIIDTFPVAVCRNIRIPTCRLLQGEAYRGFNSSKKEYFYGFKVQIITTTTGIPVQFDIFCGETGDITAFQSSQINLPAGSSLFGDKAYNDYQQEDFLLECDQIHLQPQRKSNSKRKDQPYEAFYKNHVRKMVETCPGLFSPGNAFSQITDLFPRHIHATSTKGYLLKIALFVLAFTIL